MANEIASQQNIQKGEIILYQPDETVRLEVRLEDDTVWLTQAQMAELFQTTKNNITIHIGNVYKEKELLPQPTSKESLLVRMEGHRQVTREVKLYNLDVIISVGYRVKSQRGTEFRQWANKVIKDYLLRGYAINYQVRQLADKVEAQQGKIEQIESTLLNHQEKIDFFVRTNQPPVEGIFFDGQIFDAYRFVNDLIRKAKSRIVLIDNYVDDTVLAMLDKRADVVSATIYTQHVSQQLQLDIDRHNAQYRPIAVEHFNRAHDRFLLIDDEVYHIGASLKDLGKKWFAFTIMRDLTAPELISRISGSATVNIQQ
jgi:hypothetical protein